METFPHADGAAAWGRGRPACWGAWPCLQALQGSFPVPVPRRGTQGQPRKSLLSRESLRKRQPSTGSGGTCPLPAWRCLEAREALCSQASQGAALPGAGCPLPAPVCMVAGPRGCPGWLKSHSGRCPKSDSIFQAFPCEMACL